MEKIKETAADHRKKTEDRLNLELSVSDALFKSLKGKEHPEKCELIKACYFENF